MMETLRPAASWPLRGLSLLALGYLATPLAEAGSEPQFRIVTGASAGGGPHVKRLDFAAPRVAAYPRAYPEDLHGGSHGLPGTSIAIDESGVHLALGDLNGDGKAELVTSTLRGGPGGGPHIRIFSTGIGGGGGTPALTDPLAQFSIRGDTATASQRYVAVGNYSDGSSRIVTGAGAGGGPHVKIFSGAGDSVASFSPYGDAFNSGIRVATGDVTGDGVAEIITAAGAGGGPHVKIFDGVANEELYSFEPFSAAPAGGIHVAAGDLDGDGRADVVVATGPGGGPHVKVFSGAGFSPGIVPPEVSYIPFGGSPLGGIRVATGDVNGDGRPDLVVAGVVNGRRRVEVLKSNKNGDPHANREMWTWGDDAVPEGDQFGIATGDLDGDGLVELATGGSLPLALVWSPRTNVTMDFFAYSAGFTGGVRVASGDVNGDGIHDLIVGPGAGAVPHVKVFDGRTGQLFHSFFAYDVGFTGGVFVAAGDVNGDGAADIVTGSGAGAGPHVKVFDGRTGGDIRSFFAYAVSFTGGVHVAAGDLDGDGKAEIVTGAGPGGGPHVKVFDGATGAETRNFFAFDPGYTGGIYVAAHPGSGGLLPSGPRNFAVSRIVGGGPGGGPHVKVFSGASGAEVGSLSPFGADFAGGVTIAVGDVDGDGLAEFLAAASPAADGPTVVGLQPSSGAIEFRSRLDTSWVPAGVDGEPPFFAIGSRPLPTLTMHPPQLLGEDFSVLASGTPGTWLDFETSDDLLNWLPASSTYIPDGDHILIGQTTPVVQGTRHYVRAAAK